MKQEDSDADKVKKLTEYFKKRDDIVMAFLFGSRAGGQVRKKSDWDIGVYFQPVVEAIEWEERSREYPAELEVWNDCTRILNTDDVDLIVLNRAPADISDTAIQGIPLVLKDQNLWRRFMLIISREAEDYRQFVHEYYTIAQRSSSLSARDRSEFEKIVQFLDAELSRYDYFSKMTGGEYENDVVKRNDVERWVEKIVIATIDIAKFTLSSQKKPIPDTYRENLIRASLLFKLSEEFIIKFEGWVKLRNVLAHEYLDIKWKKISNFIQTSEPYFKSFIDAAKKFLEENKTS
ncbi:MAG: DUF86 domain-containing protein [Candidatus Taylorbacteria bacterium]|nr:DUF86 domain-containing protein [Candidatus Taylorbacteria bacterium]